MNSSPVAISPENAGPFQVFRSPLGRRAGHSPAPGRRAAWLARGLFVVVLGVGSLSGALAEKADRLKPLNFTADALRYDDLRQTNVLTGNVLITKGTMVMKAGRVEVRQTSDGYQSAVALAGSGKPAYFRQKREGMDEHIEGEAGRIEYDGKADAVKLQGNAVIRRFRGNTLADEVSGPVITYDNLAEVFSVQGGGSGAEGGRVKGVLTPREAPAPAAPASGPGESR